MKQISTGSITIKRNDLKQTVVKRYNRRREYIIRVKVTLPSVPQGWVSEIQIDVSLQIDVVH